jgi:hypothetical protein
LNWEAVSNPTEVLMIVETIKNIPTHFKLQWEELKAMTKQQWIEFGLCVVIAFGLVGWLTYEYFSTH